MHVRRAVLMLTALAGLVAAVAGLSRGFEVATAALAMTTIGALGWVVLWARRVNAVLGRVEARAHETHDALDAMVARQEETQGRLSDVASALTRQQGALDNHATVQGHHTVKIDELSQNLHRVMNEVQQDPSATTELGRAYDRLVDHDRPMPEPGGWAMTSATLVWILDHIAVDGLTTIEKVDVGPSVWRKPACRSTIEVARSLTRSTHFQPADAPTKPARQVALI